MSYVRSKCHLDAPAAECRCDPHTSRRRRVGAIELRDGRWTLVDEKGGTLLVSALAEVAPSAGGRFDKRMIFGAGN